ncbi:phytochrome two-component sensor histidine kinase [Dehalogenimonas sp. WBC-2]|nr:phytochrome two-component sensor histidine kinase [Dehalogenimonas sp. WBC-2]
MKVEEATVDNRPPRTIRFGLGVRFISFVVLVALLSGGLGGLMLIEMNRDYLHRQILQTNLSQSELAAEFTDKYITAVHAHVEVFAHRPDVMQAVSENLPEQLQTTISEFVNVQTALENVGIYDIYGIQRVVSNSNVSALGRSFIDALWFKTALSTGLPYQDLPTISIISGEPVILYAVPVVNGSGLVTGILTGEISLKGLAEAIVNVDYGTDTSALVADLRGEGIIIADTNPQYVMRPLSDRFDQTVLSLTVGSSDSFEASNKGETELIGFASVPNLPWSVLVSTPKGTATAMVDVMMKNASLLLAGIILVSAIVGGFAILSVSRPLVQMRNISAKIAAGDLTKRVEVSQNSEIGDLGAAFNHMAQEIAEKESRLVEYAMDLEKRVEERTLELSRSNTDLEQFAYVASHDLQEPLRMVSSYMQLLEKRYGSKLESEAKEFMNYAVDGANRMKVIINDLLQYSRVGTRGKSPEPVNMEKVLKIAIANLSLAIKEYGAIISHEELPVIQADESQMVQVLQNLIGNAMKFHSDARPEIHIGVVDKDSEWQFSVSDNGIGLDPKYADRIFIIFQRLHTRDEYPGSGIGLAMSKRIIERHGGKIWVESTPGQGATFYFTITKKENENE